MNCQDCGKRVKRYVSETETHPRWILYKCLTHKVLNPYEMESQVLFINFAINFLIFLVEFVERMCLLALEKFIRELSD